MAGGQIADGPLPARDVGSAEWAIMNASLTGHGRESTHFRSWGVGPLRGLLTLLLLVLAGTGLAGCGARDDHANAVAKLNTPGVFYLSRKAQDIGSSTDELQVRIDTRLPSEDVTVTFHAEDLRGTATIKRGLDACKVHLPTFRCHGLSGILPFHLAPAKGAVPGDSAVLRYTLTAKGQAPVDGRTVVVVGRPVLQVARRPDLTALAPGGESSVSLDIRNTGEVPAHGVLLQVEARDGLVLADRHGNCRYKGDTDALCTLPASDVVIAPGDAYRVNVPERLRAERDAVYPEVGFSATALGADFTAPPEIASQFRPGKGPDLRLVPVKGKDVAPGAGAPSASDWDKPLHIIVHNSADLVAIGDTVRGPVGSHAEAPVRSTQRRSRRTAHRDGARHSHGARGHHGREIALRPREGRGN